MYTESGSPQVTGRVSVKHLFWMSGNGHLTGGDFSRPNAIINGLVKLCTYPNITTICEYHEGKQENGNWLCCFVAD
jgi:hypothetical protein